MSVSRMLALVLIQSFSRTSPDPDPDLVARLDLLEARTALLTKRLEQFEQARLSAAPPDQPSTRSSMGAAVVWRLGAGLGGLPLRVAAKEFDQRRGQIEVLLEIKEPLSNAADWPRQPGLPVPIALIARDTSGAVAAEQPLNLVRGPSQEPGAYLHLGAELSEQTADRVQVIELRRSR